MEDNAKNNIKEKLLGQLRDKAEEYSLDFAKLDEAHFQRRIEALFKSVLRENRDLQLTRGEQEEIMSEIASEILGLGPIDKLMKDPSVSEIMVNGSQQVYIEKNGRLELTNITFKDEQHLLYFIEKIISPVGRRVTEYEPYIDARFKDGSRVNVVKHPVSTIGAVLTIRKFSHRILTTDDLISFKTMDQFAAEFLKSCVISRRNILISGGAGSGKTTLLNILGSYIPEEERVITIEDTRELRLSRKHTVPLETRPPSIEGKGEITIRELVRNSLHMRPDRIIIGEVRGGEVLDMIQAMNTGHEGSMTTLHANSAIQALDRLEVLALMGSANMASELAKRQIISAIDLIIHMARLPDGVRKIVQISEILKGKEYNLQDTFAFDHRAGTVKFTGKVPAFAPDLAVKAGYSPAEFSVRP